MTVLPLQFITDDIYKQVIQKTIMSITLYVTLNNECQLTIQKWQKGIINDCHAYYTLLNMNTNSDRHDMKRDHPR